MHGVERVTTDGEYDDALAVRFAVFVDEQGVPEDIEVDEHEEESTHYVAYADGDAVGTVRYRAHDGAAKVERLAVDADRRGEGWGARLMDAVEFDAADAGHERATLHAQTRVVGFYERRGYERVGDVFEEAGIPHVEMEKPLGDSESGRQ